MAKKLWSGRFRQSTNRLVEDFSASIDFDWRLFREDIAGSIAHCKMLGQCGILTEEEVEKIVDGLAEIQREIEHGEFEFDHALEDIHMAIEQRLIEKIGDVGGKLHTARSRNDQIALDLRLYLRNTIFSFLKLLNALKRSIVSLAEKHSETIMPGFTHLQHAQPVVLGHHMMAYYEMFKRDSERLKDCLRRTNVMPLGSAALAGTTFPIDRKITADLLEFPELSRNSIDAVSDRDFVVEFLSAASLIMLHLSRLSEELVLWNTSEFDFVSISDSFCTGSSIMPQKKNPDVPELIRGKTGRVYGALMSVLTMMKGLPLAYNRDLQEDKEPLFDAIDTTGACIELMARLLGELSFKEKRLLEEAEKGFITATDLADYLVRKNIPFRRAHRITGEIVQYCIEKDKKLEDLDLSELKEFSNTFSEDVYEFIRVEASVRQRKSFGGTAPALVKRAIEEVKEELDDEEKRLEI